MCKTILLHNAFVNPEQDEASANSTGLFQVGIHHFDALQRICNAAFGRHSHALLQLTVSNLPYEYILYSYVWRCYNRLLGYENLFSKIQMFPVTLVNVWCFGLLLEWQCYNGQCFVIFHFYYHFGFIISREPGTFNRQVRL